MKTILILCTGNSCRSQMAEGYLRHFAGNRAVVYSAGVEQHGVNPRAIAAMQDDGIDISRHTSNLLSDYLHLPVDIVITVCDHAREQCPHFPGQALRFHHHFPDPAKTTGSETEINQAFSETRELIMAFCRKFAEEQL